MCKTSVYVGSLFKTTNSSTSERLIEYLYPSYSALSTATLQNLPAKLWEFFFLCVCVMRGREEEQSSPTFDLQWHVSSVVRGYK